MFHEYFAQVAAGIDAMLQHGLWTRQCWSESGLVSPAVSPSPQGQSPSPSPSGQSLESIRCESESIGPESESESIRPESESESSGSESESASPTEVRVNPDLSPDSAWTHESKFQGCSYGGRWRAAEPGTQI